MANNRQKSVRDLLVSLCKAQGLAEDKACAKADRHLAAAVSRAAPKIKSTGVRSFNEWRVVAHDLRTWIKGQP